MASVPMQRTMPRILRPKNLVFGLIALMLIYVLYHTEHFLIDPADPTWPHLREIGRWLLPHGVIGALALLLTFMQFSTRLRTRYARLHRTCGRIYVAAVCVVAPLGAYISYLDMAEGYTYSFVAASVTFAVLWLLATLTAFYFIRTRRMEQHRQWMTRSLAMALIFLQVRVIGGLTGWENTPATDEVVVWVCVALGYPVADVALQIQALLLARQQRLKAA
jgi:uncharacterized membrane protein